MNVFSRKKSFQQQVLSVWVLTSLFCLASPAHAFDPTSVPIPLAMRIWGDCAIQGQLCIGPMACQQVTQDIEDTIQNVLKDPAIEKIDDMTESILDQTVDTQDLLRKVATQVTGANAVRSQLAHESADRSALESRKLGLIDTGMKAMAHHQPSIELCRKITSEMALKGLENVESAVRQGIHEQTHKMYAETIPAGKYTRIAASFRFRPQEILNIPGGSPVGTGTTNPSLYFLDTNYTALRNSKKFTRDQEFAMRHFIEHMAGDINLLRPTGEAFNTSTGRMMNAEVNRALAYRDLGLQPFYAMFAARIAPSSSPSHQQAATLLRSLYTAMGQAGKAPTDTAISPEQFREGVIDLYTVNLNASSFPETPKNALETAVAQIALIGDLLAAYQQNQEMGIQLMSALASINKQESMREDPILRPLAPPLGQTAQLENEADMIASLDALMQATAERIADVAQGEGEAPVAKDSTQQELSSLYQKVRALRPTAETASESLYQPISYAP